MLVRHRPAIARRGAAAVEMACSLLVLSPLLIGTWEVSRIIEVQQVLANAAREGGRQASTGQVSASGVTTIVKTYLSAAGLPSANATVTVQDLTSPGTDPTAAAQLDQLQVTVSIKYQYVQWVSANLVTNASTNLSATAIWYSMKDKAYPAPNPPAIE